jgi:flagellar biosynthetic protein FlhB
MAETPMEERTEDATPRRREEARREGRIPRSPELTTAIALLGAAGVLAATGGSLAAALRDLVAYGLTTMAAPPADAAAVATLLRTMGGKALLAIAATVLSITAITLAVAAIQARGVLTTEPLGPNWERINPVTNGSRLLGAQPWVDLARALFKLTIVAFAAWIALEAAWPDVLALSQRPVAALPAMLRHHVLHLVMTAGLAYLALAVGDYLYQVWQHEKSLRMTKSEVKQELKQNEGDPLLKARRRSMARSLARRQMFRDVANADVVITNPTHIAVALQYDPTTAPAPVVLAMGQRKVAERIKALAAEAGVPMVENRPLARALLASAHVGMIIPAELYAAVAEVLAFVLRQRRDRMTYHPAGASR